jgi:Lrp/AsnC family transcriptional regulator, leucine-responsive regulatory protein
MTPKDQHQGKPAAQPSAAPRPAIDADGVRCRRRPGTLDRYDVAILRALQADARLSNTELARASACRPRPPGAACAGWSSRATSPGYRAEIDRRKIGLGVLAFVRVDAERNNAEATRALEGAIRACPRWWPATTSAAPAPSSCRWWPPTWTPSRAGRMDTLFKLPNVKDLHTSFSLGEVKAGAALPCNPAFVARQRLHHGELMGQPHNIVRHPDMPEAFRDMWETMAHGRPGRAW